MQGIGFLGTAAPRAADITLLLELGMGAGLLGGAWLARAGRFRLHAACQSAVVTFNFILIALMMFPAFHRQVFPKLSGRIGKPFYLIATIHAALGSIVEIAGLYILLAAGTDLLPEKFRMTRYKLWMRSILFAWWIVLLLGLATYARWYVAPG